MEALYRQTSALLHETEEWFQNLEKQKGTNTDFIEAGIQARIDTIIRYNQV